MAEKPTDPQQAMDRVLQAEREAEQAVVACEAQARDILKSAQVRANRIANRADERITLMKMRSSQWIAGEIKQREREERAALRQQIPELDERGLGECIDDIAAALSGGNSE